MQIRSLVLSTAIASALLAACSRPAEPAPAPEAAPLDTTAAAPVEPATAPASDATAPADAATPAASADAGSTPAAAPGSTAAPDPSAAASGKCDLGITGDDTMKYSVSSITVPASCSQFTINFKHVGKMPITAMGHNVVIAKQSDAARIVAEGASITPDHLKAGDARVIAATKMVGGGQSASVTFDVSKIRTGGPYQFFCSFPGHYVLMKGTIAVQ